LLQEYLNGKKLDYNAMKSIILVILMLSVPSLATFVAVLETVSIDEAINVSECRFLTDELRAQAGVSLPAYKNYTIMTRENINVMLPPGKTVEECEGSCIAETGKNIAADYVAQARVGKFESQLTLTVELYETGTGKLLGSFTAMQKNAVELWNVIKRDAGSLFALVQNETQNLGNFAKEESGWDASPIQNQGLLKKRNVSVSEAKSYSKLKKFVVDERDGRKYKVVVIGKKPWLAENMNFDDEKSECFNSDYDYCELFGRYYTWSQALVLDGNCDSKECEISSGYRRGVCPEGWHIPTLQEWDNLSSYVERKARNKANVVLKSTNEWKSYPGTNESKFNVLPGGYRFNNGNFLGKGKVARFWAVNEKNSYEAVSVELSQDSPRAFQTRDDYKASELNVRCVMDE